MITTSSRLLLPCPFLDHCSLFFRFVSLSCTKCRNLRLPSAKWYKVLTTISLYFVILSPLNFIRHTFTHTHSLGTFFYFPPSSSSSQASFSRSSNNTATTTTPTLTRIFLFFFFIFSLDLFSSFVVLIIFLFKFFSILIYKRFLIDDDGHSFIHSFNKMLYLFLPCFCPHFYTLQKTAIKWLCAADHPRPNFPRSYHCSFCFLNQSDAYLMIQAHTRPQNELYCSDDTFV